MRTLSARIVLGFAVLILAFGLIAGTLVYDATAIEDQVQLIGSGYLPLALNMNAVVIREDALKNFLEEGLTDQRDSLHARLGLKNHLAQRTAALQAARRDQLAVRELLSLGPESSARLDEALVQLEAEAAATTPMYVDLMANPPVGLAAATDPRVAKLRDMEDHLAKHASDVSAGPQNWSVRGRVLSVTGELEANEHTLRLRTIYLGGIAVLLGLLIATWVVITLRPLARLRATARRLAAGDYGSRIAERGPAEVADLAREFNSMGTAIQERERELVRSERLAAVGKMAAMITHEVRNPLSSIGLNTELLEDELAPGATEARALCRAITHEVDRLTAITEEYLAFARLPKPKVANESTNALVTALATFVREDLAARKVELVCELAAGELIALVDASQLRQCLVNLVRNAADAVAARGGGHVWLRTRVRDGRVEAEVADDGIGIAADVVPRLFDPFFSTKDGGSGLGLALTQQIVRDHGGEIRVASELGVGSTFTVRLPPGNERVVDASAMVVDVAPGPR